MKSGISLKSFEDMNILIQINNIFWPVDRSVTRSSLERKISGSSHGLAKSNSVLPTTRHCFNISSKEAVLPGRNDCKLVIRFGLMQQVQYKILIKYPRSPLSYQQIFYCK